MIRTGDGSGNTSAPADDPGWLNVGKRGTLGGTGIYLGSRWVLTANHVGVGNIFLNGTWYISTGDKLRLKEPDLSGSTDLLLLRINLAPPGLPDLNISSLSSSPDLGDEVTMIGSGRDRATDLTLWQRSGSGGTMTWTEVTSGGNESGYKTLSTQAKRWGKNVINSQNDPAISYGQGDVITLLTDFDKTGGPGDEAQAVANDSGGAVFYKNGGNWELAGVMLAVGKPAAWFNYPPVGTNSLFKCVTYSADLSVYKSQIDCVVNPTSGDMNGDCVVNSDDVSWFITALTDPDAYLAEFFFADSSEDLVRYGDVDGNGVFDFGDIGPFNDKVLGSTFAVAQTVPEPSAFSLFVAGVLSLGYLTRRR